MEAGSLYAIGAGVSAIAGSPASSILLDAVAGWWQRRKLRHRVRGLVLLKGVSTACQRLTTSDCVFIDCDKLFQNLTLPADAEALAKSGEPNPVDNLMAYSVIKRHILNICAVWKQRIVLVSKRLDLLQTLPVKTENIHFCAFSKEAEKTIGVIYADEKEHAEAQINKFRTIQELPETQVFVVDSLKDAYEAIKQKYECKKMAL